MGRVLQLIPTYALSLHRLKPPLDRSEMAAVRRLLRDLESEALPGPEDFEALVTPPAVGVAWSRRVPEYRLWVLYRFDERHASLFEIAATLPVKVTD